MITPSDKPRLLEGLSFGNRVAEYEPKLDQYFVETYTWRKILRGETDIVYGMKGVGKSAIFRLLSDRRDVPDTIKIIPAENTRGDAVFNAIKIDPPTSEVQFIYLWKLYILSLIANEPDILEALKQGHPELVGDLNSAGVIDSDKGKILSKALRYVDEVNLGGTVGVKLKAPEEGLKIIDVDRAIEELNEILRSAGKDTWVMFDRLDAVFDDNSELEQNALRALFRAYQDFAKYEHIRLKIFLRKDIWRSLTEKGLREGSHITQSDSIEWSEQNIVDLIVRRILSNPEIVEAYGIRPEEILADYEKKRLFFYRIFPKQIDPGSRKSETIRWIMSRVADGTQKVAPRELIHLLNQAKDEQIKATELGEGSPEGEALFSPLALKRALPTVSQVRMEQTIFSEYPAQKRYILALDGEKATQTSDTLSKIWEVDAAKASELANELVTIGFFEQRGERRSPEFRVPFLYRPYLNLIQGKADEEEEE